MHSFILLSGLLALGSTTVVPLDSSCGPTSLPIGAQCTTEGKMACDSTCSSVLICHDYNVMLNNACSAGGCAWHEKTGTPYCYKPPGTKSEEPDKPDLTARGSCGPSTLPVNTPCGPSMRDGDVTCDDTCKNILICHAGKTMLNSPCGLGQCIWKADTKLPYCMPHKNNVPTGGELEQPSEDTESTHQCGFTVDVGGKCPMIAREGHRFCSSDCSKVLKCNKGVMEIDHECGTSCKTDNQMELGNGAFCLSENRSPVSVDPPTAEDETAIDPYCGFTQEAGDKCSVLIKEGGRLCDKGCTKVLKCKKGIMKVAEVCGSETNSCDYDLKKKLGKGAFCRKDQVAQTSENDLLS